MALSKNFTFKNIFWAGDVAGNGTQDLVHARQKALPLSSTPPLGPLRLNRSAFN